MVTQSKSMEVGSTPGPWFATEDEFVRHGEFHRVVADVGFAPTREIAAANAHLIAAAPELLAALQTVCINVVRHPDLSHEFSINRATLERVKAAIAKALGQSGGTK